MVEEEEDAAEIFAQSIERPDDAQWPEWAGYIYGAWLELRDDRHFGSMGGMGHIYFTAIDRYAERFGISDFDTFSFLLRVIDDEYVAIMHERAKVEAEKNKKRQT